MTYFGKSFFETPASSAYVLSIADNLMREQVNMNRPECPPPLAPPFAVKADFPPVGDFIEAGGVRLHYTAEGDGPPLILVHGASGNLRDWNFSFTGKLKDRFRVIAIDRPGHGYSERAPENGACPQVQAKVLAAAADALCPGPVLIMGHSWGGALAAAWALERPDQVAGAMILSGATMPWGGDGGLLYRLGASPLSPVISALARLPLSASMIRGRLACIFSPDEAPAGYLSYIGVDLALRRSTFRWNADDIQELNGNLERMSRRYGELAMPLEIVHGDADDVVWHDVHARPMAELAQNARLTTLAGAGHMPHHSREAEVISALIRLRERAFGQ